MGQIRAFAIAIATSPGWLIAIFPRPNKQLLMPMNYSFEPAPC
jgi:hypothetical protein